MERGCNVFQFVADLTDMCTPSCRQEPSEGERLSMVKQVKGGYLLRYKKRLFGKAWREEWVVLYEDSTLAWYKEKGRSEPEGSLVVRESPEMMAVSQWTLRIPGRPDLPSGCNVAQLMAFGTRRRDKVHWLLAQSEEEVSDWMTAISNTLPPPPQAQRKPSEVKASPRPCDPVNPCLPPIQYYPSMPGEVPPPYLPPPVSHVSSISYTHPMPTTVHNTNLVVRDSVGDFAAGMMMGATVNNWWHGCGWGWGGGHGFGNGFGGAGYYHHDNDIHITNHNEVTYVNQDYGDAGGLDDGDYGMDCGGDFGF